MEEAQNYRFFQHRECEYFPCHAGVNPEDFNCLFCFCPLYALGRRCGGAFTYTKEGLKDCSACAFPHRKDHYEAVTSRYKEIQALMQAQEQP